MLSHRDRDAALEYLKRDPRENLLLIDMALAIGGSAPGDALAEPQSDLGPELAFDADRDPDAQLLALGVERHQRAAVGARHADRDLEHAREQLVRVDRELDRLDHLGQRLQELCLGQNVYNEYIFEDGGRRRMNPCYGVSPTRFGERWTR